MLGGHVINDTELVPAGTNVAGRFYPFRPAAPSPRQ